MKLLYCLIISLILTTGAHAASDTVSVYFPFNGSMLTDKSRDLLDEAIFQGILSDAQPLSIIGYTDEIGTDGYNLSLSRQRANSIKTYLVQSGFRAEKIILLTGKGEAGAQSAAGPDGNPADRRVDIVRIEPAPNGRGQLPQPGNQSVAGDIARPVRKASVTDWKTVQPGELILIDNIYFYAGRHYVRKESDEALEGLFDALAANTHINVSIEGHVCCVSSKALDAIDDDTHRMELSVNRARAIRDYLVEKGIAPERIQYRGFGRRKPVVPVEHTEEEADQNRRVEIRIIP